MDAEEDRQNLILAELARRKQSREGVAAKVAAIKKELYDKQIAVVDDPAREIAVLGTRRAGKTEIWKRITTIKALENPGSIGRIWAISRLRCKELIWIPLVQLLKRHKIEFTANETELRITLGNGSEIRLVGADKDKEVQKKRGDKTIVEIVLESQSFGAHLKGIVEDVAGPCLFDLNGQFFLEGTPGPVCVGFWFDVSGGEDVKDRWISKGNQSSDEERRGTGAGWSCHRLDVLTNPFLPGSLEKVAKIKAARRWADDNPTYLREWRGRWVSDLGALYYAFDPIRNTYKITPEFQPWGPGWMHTLGWDLGGKDDMALTVWGFHPKHGELYEAFSWKKSGASMEEVMEQIAKLKDRGFNFVEMFADTGGGGLMYVEQVARRYPYAFLPAKKTEKYAHVRLMNDELRTGFVKLVFGSEYANEMAGLARDLRDWPDPDDPEKPPSEDPRCPNHCCDAGLYAFRGAMHYLHRDVPDEPQRNTVGWFKKQEAAMIKRLEDQKNKAQRVWLDSEDQPEPDWLEDQW